MPNLNIVTALHCESKSLIEYFKLKKMTQPYSPFSIFVNTEKTIHLIISGVGKVNAAIATTFLHSFSGGNETDTFLNVGIAGSSFLEIGSYAIVNKIIDSDTGRSWYPYVSPLKKYT